MVFCLEYGAQPVCDDGTEISAREISTLSGLSILRADCCVPRSSTDTVQTTQALFVYCLKVRLTHLGQKSFGFLVLLTSLML